MITEVELKFDDNVVFKGLFFSPTIAEFVFWIAFPPIVVFLKSHKNYFCFFIAVVSKEILYFSSILRNVGH